MIDKLKRFREPAALLALIVVVLESGLTIFRFVVELRTTALTTVMRGTTGLFGLVDGMVVTALVLSCVMVVPVTSRARLLTFTSALVMAIGAVTGLVLLVGALLDPAGWFSRLLESVGGIADIAFKGLFAWLLWHGYQAVSEAEAEGAGPTGAGAGAGAGAAPVPPEPSRGPTWATDQATGVVWRRAGDAASGAAAATYEATGQGWTPAAVAELPAIRPDGSILPPLPGDAAAEAQAALEASEPTATRAVRVIVGDDDGSATPRQGPPSWDPTFDVSRPARGI